MTNGDKIRAMTDEELAESLSGSVACKHITGCLDTSCYECTLIWLKQVIDAQPTIDAEPVRHGL